MALMYIICWEQHFNQHKELSLFFIIKCSFQLSWLYFILFYHIKLTTRMIIIYLQKTTTTTTILCLNFKEKMIILI